jgi:hypothetical protein
MSIALAFVGIARMLRFAKNNSISPRQGEESGNALCVITPDIDGIDALS